MGQDSQCTCVDIYVIYVNAHINRGKTEQTVPKTNRTLTAGDAGRKHSEQTLLFHNKSTASTHLTIAFAIGEVINMFI